MCFIRTYFLLEVVSHHNCHRNHTRRPRSEHACFLLRPMLGGIFPLICIGFHTPVNIYYPLEPLRLKRKDYYILSIITVVLLAYNMPTGSSDDRELPEFRFLVDPSSNQRTNKFRCRIVIVRNHPCCCNAKLLASQILLAPSFGDCKLNLHFK